ncbi:unnamed protein product, partial [Mesorhabditis spiculigera]
MEIYALIEEIPYRAGSLQIRYGCGSPDLVYCQTLTGPSSTYYDPGCYAEYQDPRGAICSALYKRKAGVIPPESTDAARSSGTDERRRLAAARRAELAQQAINERLHMVLFFHGILLPICVAITALVYWLYRREMLRREAQITVIEVARRKY